MLREPFLFEKFLHHFFVRGLPAECAVHVALFASRSTYDVKLTTSESLVPSD
jgi:hypothetical protein